MANDDKYKKKPGIKPYDADTEDDGSEGGDQGGQGGHIEFREFIGAGGSLRDDLLSGEEKRRLLNVHKHAHVDGVKKQKEKRSEREKVRKGELTVSAYRQGQGQGMGSTFKNHPTLSDKAQFSGIDKQVNALPTINDTETNKDVKELVLRNELKNRLTAAPTFNPKPLPR